MKNIALILFTITLSLIAGCKSTPTADDIHMSLLTVDTHVDTPMLLTSSDYNLAERHEPGSRIGKIDFPRMKEGGLDGVFFAIFVAQGERTDDGNFNAMKQALLTFDTIKNVLNRYPDLANLALTSGDLKKINSQDKLAIFIGMENGYPVGNDIGLVEEYYNLGARYITLCHSGNNDICESVTGTDDPDMDGLSDFGGQVVREMNRLGMIIDVSHASDKSFYDVLDISSAPVMASHSSSRALQEHPRNMSDSMLVALAEKGGVIQVCAVTAFINENPYPERDSARNEIISRYGRSYEVTPGRQEDFLREWSQLDSIYPPKLASVADYVDHIDHIVEIAGIDHVGIGTDFDGGGELADCYDVSQLGSITGELIKRGYSEDDLSKIWGGNFLRLFSEVEKIAGKND